MKILGIIPARKGSKRIPNKNWKLLNGRPLVEYIISSALKSKLLDDIVITTDSKEVIEIGSKFSNIEIIERPDSLADDESPAIDYVDHAISILESKNNCKYEIIVILQPTSPLTLSEDIDNTINELLNSTADSSVSVVKLSHAIHPFKLKLMDQKVLIPYLEEENGRMAAHEMPDIYVRNCAVYASKRSVIEERKIIGSKCLGYEMPDSRSIDINDQIDFEFAEFLMNKHNKL